MEAERSEVDWSHCTGQKVYSGGEESTLEGVMQDVESQPVVTKTDPDCFERQKEGHP